MLLKACLDAKELYPRAFQFQAESESVVALQIYDGRVAASSFNNCAECCAVIEKFVSHALESVRWESPGRIAFHTSGAARS
jgi:hypothetical protein